MRQRVIAGLLVAAMSAAGCAGRTERVRTETSSSYSSASSGTANAAPGAPATQRQRTVESSTHVTQTVPDDERRGVLGTTVHVIGEVLAMPFRLVAGLVRLIF